MNGTKIILVVLLTILTAALTCYLMAIVWVVFIHMSSFVNICYQWMKTTVFTVAVGVIAVEKLRKMFTRNLEPRPQMVVQPTRKRQHDQTLDPPEDDRMHAEAAALYEGNQKRRMKDALLGIKPMDIIPVLLKINPTILKFNDIRQIKEITHTKGDRKGAEKLVERLSMNDDWLPCIMKALVDPSFKTETKRMENEIDELRMQIEQEKAKMQKLEEETAREAALKSKKIEELEADKLKYEEQRQKHQEELDELKNQEEKLTSKIKKLQKKSTKSELDETTRKLQEMMQELEQTRESLRERTREYDELQKKLQSLQKDMKSQNKSICEVEKGLGDMRTKIQALEKEKESKEKQQSLLKAAVIETESTQWICDKDTPKKIRHIFEEQINLDSVLSVFHKYNINVLTVQDIEKVRAAARNCGRTSGARELLDLLPLYKHWLPCLLRVLRDPQVKQSHVAELILQTLRAPEAGATSSVATTTPSVTSPQMEGLSMTHDVTLLVVGRTGNGKSATANSIVQSPQFVTASSTNPTATPVQEGSMEIDGCHIRVLDCPGFGGAELDNEEALKKACMELINAVSFSPNSFSALLLVHKFGNRFWKEDNHYVTLLKKIWGKTVLQDKCVIVITHGDNFDSEVEESAHKFTFANWLTQQSGEFGKLLAECNQRCVLFRNKTKDPLVRTRQVKELLSHVRILEGMAHYNTAVKAV